MLVLDEVLAYIGASQQGFARTICDLSSEKSDAPVLPKVPFWGIRASGQFGCRARAVYLGCGVTDGSSAVSSYTL